MVSGPFGNLSLPPDLERFVAEGVSSGRFASANDVVVDALLLLREHEAWKADAREKIAEGLAQAKRGELLDGDEVLNRLRDKIDRARQGREEAA